MISSIKIIPLIFLALGVFILMQILLPLASYKIWEITLKYSNQLLVSPQSQTQILGVSIENRNNFPAIHSVLKRDTKPPFSQFSLSIKKIGLEDVPVLIDSNDFSKSLAQLPGSALPGEKGNLFITGHSAAAFLFSKNQEAYFAKLSDIKKGDEVLVNAGGANFKYKVVEFKIVSPSDLSVIYPLDNTGRYISLMTCVPPGINTKRLVVIGKMI